MVSPDLFLLQQLPPSYLNTIVYPAFYLFCLASSYNTVGYLHACIFTETDCIILRKQKHSLVSVLSGAFKPAMSKPHAAQFRFSL